MIFIIQCSCKVTTVFNKIKFYVDGLHLIFAYDEIFPISYLKS